MGAQAIGNFGATVTALTFQKVARITGLDPARPYFETLNHDAILEKSDALFVDVIHTNSGNLTHVSAEPKFEIWIHNCKPINILFLFRAAFLSMINWVTLITTPQVEYTSPVVTRSVRTAMTMI